MPLAERLDPLQDRVTALGVDPHGRFVENEQIGMVKEPRGDVSRRFMPPENESTRSFARSFNSHSSSASATRSRTTPFGSW